MIITSIIDNVAICQDFFVLNNLIIVYVEPEHCVESVHHEQSSVNINLHLLKQTSCPSWAWRRQKTRQSCGILR